MVCYFLATKNHPILILSLVVQRQVSKRRSRGRIRLLQCDLVRPLSLRDSISRYELLLYSGWDIHDTVYSRELAISNRQNGYRDLVAVIDLSTFRRIPWENNVPFFLVSFLDPETSTPICADPRGVLRKASDDAAAHGMTCVAGVEFEVSGLNYPCNAFNVLRHPSQYFNFKGESSYGM